MQEKISKILEKKEIKTFIIYFVQNPGT